MHDVHAFLAHPGAYLRKKLRRAGLFLIAQTCSLVVSARQGQDAFHGHGLRRGQETNMLARIARFLRWWAIWITSRRIAK